MKKILLLHLALVISKNIYGTVHNVPASYSSIQSALNACQSDDTVMVAPGHYIENIQWPSALHVDLIGSGSAVTIIDGNMTGSVIVKNISTPDNYVTITGFRITNGLSTINSQIFGAGIFFRNTELYIADVILDSNRTSGTWTYGTALGFEDCDSVVINGVQINNNISEATSVISGVGLFALNCSLYVSNTTIANNRSFSEVWNYGCGAYFENSTVDIKTSSIRDNIQYALQYSQSNGAGVYSVNSDVSFVTTEICANESHSKAWTYGAGIHHGGKHLSLLDCRVDSNVVDSTSDNYGVGIYLEHCQASINQTQVSYNKGISDGWNAGTGISGTASQINIDKSVIQFNSMLPGSTNYVGAAMNFTDCNTTVLNSLITSNVIDSSVFYPGFPGIVSTIDLGTARLEINHCTIADHNSYSSPYGNSVLAAGQLIIKNSIVYSNASIEIGSDTSLTTITYSDITNGYPGIGNISSDPLFTSPGNYDISFSSPCAGSGSGNMSYDIGHNSRPLPSGTNPDIGAYEIDQIALGVPVALASIIQLSPNPSRNRINIKVPESINKILIYDIAGRLLQSGSSIIQYNNPSSIDVSNLLPGVYHILVIGTEKTYTSKFIKE